MTKRQVFDGIVTVLNTAGVPGAPFTRRDITTAILAAAAQANEDEWVDATSGGVQRWRRVAGDNKWYVSAATSSIDGTPRLVELHTAGGCASLSIYATGGLVFNNGSPMDGWRCTATESVTADVSTNALAWECIATRIAAGAA